MSERRNMEQSPIKVRTYSIAGKRVIEFEQSSKVEYCFHKKISISLISAVMTTIFAVLFSYFNPTEEAVISPTSDLSLPETQTVQSVFAVPEMPTPPSILPAPEMPVPSSAAADIRVWATGNVNVREAPRLDAQIVSDIPKGSFAYYLGRTISDDRGVNWYFVETRIHHRVGWISSRYASMDK